MNIRDKVFLGHYKEGHCQGMAVDTKGEYVYYSFTTLLVKTDRDGNVVGTVSGLLGHLGCLAFNHDDGRLYGSLEYKNDAIGKGILRNIGSDAEISDSFHIAIFDVEKIDRMGMDASDDGVMKTVFLKEVLDDYSAKVECGGKIVEHRHGCSGIDGVTFAPIPGTDGKKHLFVAYGVYEDVNRSDNDYQVILCYDTAGWNEMARPLLQSALHTSGPEKPLHKYFVRTGNTCYGVQNLEYFAEENLMLMAVYPGSKKAFVNHRMFAVDMKKPAVTGEILGVEPKMTGEILSLSGEGWDFLHGSTGICSLGGGRFAIAIHGQDEKGYFADLRIFKWDGINPMALEMDE